MRNFFRRQFACVLVFILLQVSLVSVVQAEFQLSNGQKAYIGDTYSISLLGTRKAGNDELRSLAKQIEAVRKVEKTMRSWGINVDRQIHIRFYTDTDFSARDMWRSAGIEPNVKALDKYEEDTGMVFTSLSGYEYAHMSDDLDDVYFFLNPFPDYIKRKYFVNPRALTGALLNDALGAVKSERIRIEEGLDKPVGQQLNDYMIFKSAAYSSDKSVLWVPVTKPDALHRYLDTTIHEYGHHVFNMMVKAYLNKNNNKKKWTNIQIFYICSNILAVNEFFADYVAVANGYNKCINLHKYGAMPKDMKRVFSQERTLKSYLEEIKKGSKDVKYYLSEGHNSLNPMRSFVWKLRFAIGDKETDKLVVTAVQNAISNFFSVDMAKYPRVRLTAKGWGCFTIKGYPIDVTTENLRFLNLMQKAADKQLTSEQKKKFSEVAANVFAGFYPLK
ncbi:MAG: hypothetical protein KKB51_14960 [Candidatus Riflebacteria bacterium]|nr:hypothetical protein [Candidatus Riflebacteria bacterium]